MLSLRGNVPPLFEWDGAVGASHPGPPEAEERFKSFGGRGLPTRDIEVIKLIAPLVNMIPRKAGHVVDDEFSVVDKGQTARCCIAKELVSEASDDERNDFSLPLHSAQSSNVCSCIVFDAEAKSGDGFAFPDTGFINPGQ